MNLQTHSPNPEDATAGILGSRRADVRDVLLASRSSACLLLTGPPRETRDLAYLVHTMSGWRHGPFMVVDCTASEHDLERDLFASIVGGDERRGARSYARASQDGSVLLQDIGWLSAEFQRRLAELLIELRGDGSGRSLRRRIMASTSFPLIDAVREGTFDDRLYYRLNVIQLGGRG